MNIETQKNPKILVVDRLGPTFLVGLFFLCLVFASSSATAKLAEARRGWLLLERDNCGNKEIVTILDSLPAEDIRIKYPGSVRHRSIVRANPCPHGRIY